MNRKRERYSVDYWSIYKDGFIDKLLSEYIKEAEETASCSPLKGQKVAKIKLPRLLNAHSFDKTDHQGEPKLTYATVPRANPKFAGNTLFETLRESYDKEVCEMFDKSYGREFCFDGDTIEFVTQNFYCKFKNTHFKKRGELNFSFKWNRHNRW